MNPIQPAYLELLKQKLSDQFVPHLPPILDTTKPQDQIVLKNLSRAFSAFVLHHLCGVPAQVAAQAVVDDFNDRGVDAIYFDQRTDTLFLVQTKIKEREEFKEDEALAFCQGVRKLIQQDLTGFNEHVQKRQNEVEAAVETCASIQLVIAYVGSRISGTAKTVIQELLVDTSHGDDRFCPDFIAYDAERVVADLRGGEAPKSVDTTIYLDKYQAITTPEHTHLGLIRLTDLVDLYKEYGPRLYEKNIRTFLGRKTEVNAAIRRTLAEDPGHFFYLNNGITALVHEVGSIGLRAADRRKRLPVKDFSIVNGAQTITSAAQFLIDNPNADITAAQVAITLIEVADDDNFGKAITQARNHQNQVSIADFASLDDEQERLRRDLALLKVRYRYKGGADTTPDPATIRFDEAAAALALFQPDPRFVVWLKRTPNWLLTVQSEPYSRLFTITLTAQQLINAVRFRRYVQERVADIVRVAYGPERLTYLHGEYALGWVLAQRIRQQQSGHQLIDNNKLRTVLSEPFDTLRQTLWDETSRLIGNKGPLALFRNQTDVIQLLETVCIRSYRQAINEAALTVKRRIQNSADPYPIELFTYLTDKAPQLSNLI